MSTKYRKKELKKGDLDGIVSPHARLNRQPDDKTVENVIPKDIINDQIDTEKNHIKILRVRQCFNLLMQWKSHIEIAHILSTEWGCKPRLVYAYVRIAKKLMADQLEQEDLPYYLNQYKKLIVKLEEKGDDEGAARVIAMLLKGRGLVSQDNNTTVYNDIKIIKIDGTGTTPILLGTQSHSISTSDPSPIQITQSRTDSSEGSDVEEHI